MPRHRRCGRGAFPVFSLTVPRRWEQPGTQRAARRRGGDPGWGDHQGAQGRAIACTRGAALSHRHGEGVSVPAPPPVRKDSAPGTDNPRPSPDHPHRAGTVARPRYLPAGSCEAHTVWGEGLHRTPRTRGVAGVERQEVKYSVSEYARGQAQRRVHGGHSDEVHPVSARRVSERTFNIEHMFSWCV